MLDMRFFEIHKLKKFFGGLIAVNDLDFGVEESEIVGLIGPNGAGKTTVFNLITGVLRPSQGRIFFNGEDITGRAPYIITQKGLARTFQLTALFQEMTVLQNVVLGFYIHSSTSLLKALVNNKSNKRGEGELKEEAEKLLAYMGLADFKNELAKNLPHGLHRTLGVSIALATNPKLLLLDEPLTGMNAEERKTMLNKIRDLREQGITILLVEHDIQSMMTVCDRICVLNFGNKIAEGSPSEIGKNPEVIKAYLGAEYAT